MKIFKLILLVVLSVLVLGLNWLSCGALADEITIEDICACEDVDITRSMEVSNPDGKLSSLSFIHGDTGYICLFSGLSTSDHKRCWNDLIYFKEHRINDVQIYLNSPGGDAFAGMAIADEIERAQRNGFDITVYASGIVASAAVPIFAVCDYRVATPGTIFMTHQPAMWKWPGRETASDIRAQNELMEILQANYVNYLVKKTNLNAEEWQEKIDTTTWFCVDAAVKFGLVDKID